MNEFSFRFWGVRGALASCSADTMRYGSNTACVEVVCGDRLLILDAGSGFRMLGTDLLGRSTRRADLLFTHCHYDHISGIPFFAPFFDPEWSIDIWSGHLERENATRSMFLEYMRPPFFPVGPEVFTATLRYRDFSPGDALDLGDGIAISTCLLHHHDRAVAYRIEYEGRSLAYVTDTTHIPGKPDLTILAFIEGVDTMIYDATYTDAEFPRFWNFGHSTWEEGVRLAEAAGVRHYIPFHHRPSRSDDELDGLERAARASFPATTFAREGERFEVAAREAALDAGGIG